MPSKSGKRKNPLASTRRFEWRNGFDSSLILAKFASIRKIDNSRSCSFDAFEYAFWLPILKTAINAESNIGSLADRCIRSALSDAKLTLNNPATFLERCERAYDKLATPQKTKFVVYSTVTYTGQKPINWLKLGDIRIQWQPSEKSKFSRTSLKARESLSHLLKSRRVSNQTNGLTVVLVHLSAQNANEAQQRATDAFDLVRGLLNLLVNSSRSINPFAELTPPHAINRFRRGPFHTVHKQDGNLALEMFWYQPRWEHEHQSVKFKDVESYRRSVVKWWEKIERNPLRNHIRSGLLRYCRALDQHEFDAALLEMWGALEFLTGTQNEKYDVTVSRIERLFKDREDARLIANHVRIRRNLSIHAAKSLEVSESDAVLMHADILVRQILFFCIRESGRFSNKDELFEFLDVSYDERAFKRKIRLSKFFFEYQKR
jgi:hypothetical protein